MESRNKQYASSSIRLHNNTNNNSNISDQQSAARCEPSDLNSSSDNEQIGSPTAEDSATHILDGGNSDVWNNLREIFADLDAHNQGGESKQALKKPIMKLRRLLEMHIKLLMYKKGDEELTLEKVYLGLRVEREWYLRKLQAIEVALGPLPLQGQFSADNQLGNSPTLSFTKAILTILYEDNEDYTLVGSKWH